MSDDDLSAVTDLAKARWYIDREIARITTSQDGAV